MPSGFELRKRQIYGLLLLALALIVAALWRAPLRDIFPAGWWRGW